MNAATAQQDDLPQGHSVLGPAWTSLFASLESGVGDAPALAQHLLDLWRDGRARTLSLTATHLNCGPNDSLDSTALPWILPAFLAGLREITILDDTSVDDVGAFAVALSRLESHAKGIRDFHDWLWSESACGFKLKLTPSMIEKAQSRWTTAQPPHDRILEQNSQPALVDIAQVFATKLEHYLDHAPPLLEVAAVEASQKAAQLQSDVGWVSSQLFCLLNLVHLQNQMETHVVASRLMKWLSVGVNAQSLNALLDLQSQEGFGTNVFAHLISEDLGTRLGQSITLDGEEIRKAAGRLFTKDVVRRNAFLRALVSRCTQNANAARFFRDVAYHLNPNALFEAICGPHLGPDEVGVLIDFAMTNTTAGDLDVHLEEVDPSAIIDSLERIEAHLLPSFSKTLTRLLLSQGDAAERAAELLNTLPAPAQVALAQEVFSRKQPLCSTRLEQRLSDVLQDVPAGRNLLVEVVRDQERSTTLRVAALTSLHNHPNERAQAARFRLSEWREPSRLREQLKAARKKPSGESHP